MRTMERLSLLVFVLLIACGEDESGASNDMPNLNMGSVELEEGNDGVVTAVIILNLDNVSDQEVSMDFFTSDDTALEGVDYVSSSGTITIPAGEMSVELELEVISDTFLELTEVFNLNIANVTNARSTIDLARIKIVDDDSGFQPEEDEDGFITPLSYPSMVLVWSDEFDEDILNESNWSYDIGDGCEQDLCGWGNKELQVYSKDEKTIFNENGKLTIRARETFTGTYESARIVSKGKREFQYGRIDIRAKLPQGQGLWPALWLLGTNIDEVGWPKSGEIDIMELVGHEANVVHGTAHYDVAGHQYEGSTKVLPSTETFGDKYHIFSILWDETGIEWYLDYQRYFRITPSDVGSTYPFNNPFYFIFNVAVGGEWPGSPDDSTVFPQEMQIDYVRVFR